MHLDIESDDTELLSLLKAYMAQVIIILINAVQITLQNRVTIIHTGKIPPAKNILQSMFFPEYFTGLFLESCYLSIHTFFHTVCKASPTACVQVLISLLMQL